MILGGLEFLAPIKGACGGFFFLCSAGEKVEKAKFFIGGAIFIITQDYRVSPGYNSIRSRQQQAQCQQVVLSNIGLVWVRLLQIVAVQPTTGGHLDAWHKCLNV